MNRLRVLLLGITVLALLLIIGFAWRAYVAMQQEQLLYHQVLAQDVFDHLDLQLALLIRDEERRPFTDYQKEIVPDQPLAGVPLIVQSPLKKLDPQQPIKGYFQRDDQNGAYILNDIDFDIAVLDQTAHPKNDSAWPTLQNKQTEIAQNQVQSIDYDDNRYLKSRSGNVKSLRNFNNKAEQRVSDQSLQQYTEQSLQQEEFTPVTTNDGAVAVNVSPFSFKSLNDSEMLMCRSVDIPQSPTQVEQGFIVDTDRLQQSLQQSLQQQEQWDESWRVHWFRGEQLAAAQSMVVPDQHFGFYHACAEPFSQMAVVLEMPIDDNIAMSDRQWMFVIIVLGSALLVTGIIAVDRLLVQRQRFIERRQNFVAAVSHELKTPLTAIRMHAEMLEAGMLADERRQEYYQTIHGESQRLSRLIDNVLTLSQLEKNEYQAHLQVGNVASVVTEAVQLLQGHVQAHGFSLELEVPESVPAVQFERDAVLQIVFNCVDNAIKFATGSDEQRINIMLEIDDGALSLRIRDFGPGVPVEQQAYVFDAFYRGERELTRRTKGTGIGLSLVQQLAAAMRAAIAARNHPQGGFEISIRFPLLD